VYRGDLTVQEEEVTIETM